MLCQYKYYPIVSLVRAWGANFPLFLAIPFLLDSFCLSFFFSSSSAQYDLPPPPPPLPPPAPFSLLIARARARTPGTSGVASVSPHRVRYIPIPHGDIAIWLTISARSSDRKFANDSRMPSDNYPVTLPAARGQPIQWITVAESYCHLFPRKERDGERRTTSASTY
jgi:hypothetical protein